MKISTQRVSHIFLQPISNMRKPWEEQSNFLLRAKNRWRICGNGSTVLTAERAPVIQCKRRIQCNFCSWKCTWGCNVLRKRCRKLPTASAVVADVVEMAKNLDKNIPVEWSSKKLELVDYRSAKNRFFVRVSGTDKTFVEKYLEM